MEKDINKKNKVLLVGSTNVSALELSYIKYINKNNQIDLNIYSISNFLSKNINWGYRLLRFISPSRNLLYSKLNSELRSTLEQIQPNIVIVFKGMQVYPSTLLYAKTKNIKLINYNPDHPFTFSGRGSGNKNITNSISIYNLHLTYNSLVKPIIEQKFGIPCPIIPFGYNIGSHNTDHIIEEREEILCVCFIGNPDKIRSDRIKFLLNNNIQVHIYGNNWEKYIDSQSFRGLKIFRPVYDEEFWVTMRKYRVQLNIFRPHNLGSHNMRTFEIPAIGGIMVGEYSQEQLAFFEDHKDAFFYHDNNDMLTKVRRVLDLSIEEANKIRESARNRCVTSKYHYKYRAKQMIDILSTINHEKES
jgi:spore maturation protein CgeB